MTTAFNPVHVREEGCVASTGNTASATHAAAVITYPAVPGLCNALYGIAWSYSGSGTLSGGNITLADGSSTVFTMDVTSAGAGFIPFGTPFFGSMNTAMTITLADGSANVAGKINAVGYFVGPYPSWAQTNLNLSNPLDSGLISVL